MIHIHNYNGPLGTNPNYWTTWTIDAPKTDQEEYRTIQVLQTFINNITPHSNN